MIPHTLGLRPGPRSRSFTLTPCGFLTFTSHPHSLRCCQNSKPTDGSPTNNTDTRLCFTGCGALLSRLPDTQLPGANMEPLRPPAHPPGRRGGRRRARRPSPGAHLRRCPRPIAGRLFERASQSAAPGPRRLGRRARRLLRCGARAEGIRAGKALSWHGGRPRRMALLPAAGAVSRAWVPGRGCAAGRPGSWVELGHALEGCLTMPATPPRSDRELGLPAAEPSHLQAE